MANQDFQTVKSKIDLADYIRHRPGLELKPTGATIEVTECPFCRGHGCFRIYPETQSFNCFQCPEGDKGGDIFTFVQKEKRCTAIEALHLLAKEIGYELTGSCPDPGSRHPAGPRKANHIQEIFEAAAGYYHNALLSNSAGIGYQRKVRRHSDETLKAFRVGHTDGNLLQHLIEKGFSRQHVIESGLTKDRDGSLQDHFMKNLYIYPHLDTAGRVANFTVKDPNKKYDYKLNKEFAGPDCLFFNMPAFKGNAVFLVEGENDLLSVYGRGGHHQVAALCGQISKEQIDFIVSWAVGKTLYLCFDNDKAGKSYTKKICQALKGACMPDTLAGLLKERTADIRTIRFDSGADDIDDYLKKQTDPETALKCLMEGAHRYYPPLKELGARYSNWVKDQERKYSYDEFGQICFDWFQSFGKFFVDHETCYLFLHNTIYQIGNSTPFKAMMYNLAGLNAASNGARLVWQSIESQAYLKGDHTSVPGWICTNFKDQTIFFNLCNEKHDLLKLSPGKIEIIPNGTNPQKVLLRNSPKMKSIRFMPDADKRKGMECLKRHFFDNLACNTMDRYFVLCLLINTPLMQYTKARGITKFSGTKGSGKTAAASMLSTIVYGEDCVTTGSAASDFSEAAVSPLTISDNLESDAVRGGKKDFLITAATGITRQKRKAGTDSENVYEKSCTQLLVTSIEPFSEPELIERTNEIHFDRLHFNSEFREAMTLEADLLDNRNAIWGSIFKIITEDILPDIGTKKEEALKKIRKLYPNHAKSRLNELYAMLFIILGEVVKYVPHPEYVRDSFKRDCQDSVILSDWIKAQGDRALNTETETDKVLYRLETLIKEYRQREENFHAQYSLKAHSVTNEFGELLQVTFTCTTLELYRAFEWMAKDRGISNPFKSASQLSARLNDSIQVIQSAGWEIKRNVKIVKGNRFHTLIKTFAE